MDQVELTHGLLAKETDDSALERTGKLLAEGFLAGSKERVKELSEAPAEVCGTVALCAATGAALNLMSRAGGRWGTAAKVASGTMAVLLAGDVLRRGVPTVGAIADNWHSPETFEHNKEVVSTYAGSALVDYPLMMAAGYAGFRGAGAAFRPVPDMISLSSRLNEVQPFRVPVSEATPGPRLADIQVNPAFELFPPGRVVPDSPIRNPWNTPTPGTSPGAGPYEIPPIQAVRMGPSPASCRIDLEVMVGYELPPIGRITPDSPVQPPWTTPVLPKMVRITELPGALPGNPGAYEIPPIPRLTFNGGKAIQALAAQQRALFVPATVPVDLLRVKR